MQLTRHRLLSLAAVLALAMAACQPAAPEAPAVPPKPAEPAATPAPKPAEPAAKPVEPKPEAKPAPEQDPIADFYRGQTVRIIVGFSAGGGFDTYARLVARHLSNHIPGNPTVIVENMTGAGSLVAANHVFNAAPKDGTIIGNFAGGLVLQRLIVEDPSVEFEPGQFNWLPTPASTTPACAARVESGFTSIEQAREQELFIGVTAPGDAPHDIPSVLKTALDLNINLVPGYAGTADIRLAADRGEVDAACWGWESIAVTWAEEVAAGNVIPIGQGGAEPHPDLPGVPHFLDLAETDEARQLLEAGILAPALIIRAHALPPGVPEERVEAMRQAFAAVYEDPAFLDEAERAQIFIDPVTVDQFEQTIRNLEALPDDLRQQLRTAISP